MSLTIRPLTPAERKYTYAQSRQLIGQTIQSLFFSQYS